MKYVKITEYKNYREYLRDYYSTRKSQDPKFSYRFFTRKAGINSSGLYSNLVSGTKNLTISTAAKFAEALELSEKEISYFQLMLKWTHSQNTEHKENLEEEMSIYWSKSVRRYHFAQKSFFSTWYHSAIIQSLHILNVKDSKKDYQQVAKFLRMDLSLEEIKKSFELLAELEMIKLDSNGIYKPTHSNGIAGKEVGIKTIREFQKTFIELGKNALDEVEPCHRHVVSNTMSASLNSIEKVKMKIQLLQNEIHEIVQSESQTDQVFQLNIQFFPLSVPENRSQKDETQ